jgi:signal transduction histidine kinase
MVFSDYISVGVYWFLVIVWGLIVLVFLTRYEQPKAKEPRVAAIARVILLLGFAVLAIDSIYFSVWFTAKDEATRTNLFTNLMQSEFLLVPKVVLLVAAVAGLILTWRNRVKEIEKETENLRKISALNAIAATVSQSLNLEEILNSTLEKVLEVMRIETGAIALMDEQDEELSLAVHRGLAAGLLHQAASLEPGQGLTGRAAQLGEPILVEDISEEDGLSGIELGMKEEGFRSFACIPLAAKEKVLGVMDIASHDLRQFSPQDVELLTSIGNQIGVAIDNARLFHDLNEAYEDLAATKARLFQSAKLSAVGEFAAGIAHEIRNPLTTIIGDAQLLMTTMKPDQLEYESLKAIERSGRRASKVIGNLLSFSRQEEYELVPTDINATINNALSLIAYQIERSNITIIKDLSADLSLVLGSTHHLEDVWINLLINARDAIPAKQRGEIRIASRLDGSGKAVQVLISDTGVGIPKANLERVFEPFFTTKDVNEGTGLGLYITYKTIERHNGLIELESEEGQGTTVTVTLPVTNQVFVEEEDQSLWEVAHGPHPSC